MVGMRPGQLLAEVMEENESQRSVLVNTSPDCSPEAASQSIRCMSSHPNFKNPRSEL